MTLRKLHQVELWSKVVLFAKSLLCFDPGCPVRDRQNAKAQADSMAWDQILPGADAPSETADGYIICFQYGQTLPGEERWALGKNLDVPLEPGIERFQKGPIVQLCCSWDCTLCVHPARGKKTTCIRQQKSRVEPSASRHVAESVRKLGRLVRWASFGKPQERRDTLEKRRPPNSGVSSEKKRTAWLPGKKIGGKVWVVRPSTPGLQRFGLFDHLRPDSKSESSGEHTS